MMVGLFKAFRRPLITALTFSKLVLRTATRDGASLILPIKSCSFLRLCEAVAVMPTMPAVTPKGSVP